MYFKDKIVMITGASSGIGLACAMTFAREGARLILCARRIDRMQELAALLKKDFNTESYIFGLDVQNYFAVTQSIQALPSAWQAIDVLVNSAGLALGFEKIQEADVSHWDQMIDTNIKGLLYVTRQVLPLMLQRNRGHIVNLGSISSHQVYSGGVAYCATKFAVKAISEGLKMDVHGTPIRVSSVDPGMVDTEFSTVRFAGDRDKASQVYKGVTPLTGEDVAEAILFCVTRPAHVNVREIKIYPTAQTASLMCHREEE